MRRRPQILLLLAAVAIVLSLLVFLTGGFVTWRTGTKGGSRASRTVAQTRGASAPGAREQAPAGKVSAPPALFGRTGEPRAGRGSAAGRVVDFRTGWPVAGAAGVLTGKGFGGEDLDVTATTDEEGRIAFASVPAGTGYALRLEAEDLPVRAVPGIDVSDGNTTDLGTLWLGARAALAGLVVDPEGRGVSEAVVDLHRGTGALSRVRQDFGEMLGRLDREEVPAVRVRADASGAFRSEPIDPGPWTLLVRAPGFAQRSLGVAMTSEGVAGGGLRIEIRPGASVAGHVVDETGAGIEGARVAVMTGDDPDAFLYGRVFVTTGAGGAFHIDTLPDAEDLTAVVAAPGSPTTFASLEPGQQDARIVVHRSVRLVVRVVTEEEGTPVAGANLVVAVGDRPDVEEQPGTLVSGTTDAGGGVVLDVRSGALQMAYVTHREHSPAMWTAGANKAMPGLLKGPDDPAIPDTGRDVVFRLPTSIAITGRVTDAAGTPLPGAQVQALGPTGLPQTTVTDAEGRYRVLAPSFGGRQAAAFLIVRAPGFVQPPETRRVPPAPTGEATVSHDVRLRPAGSVSGRVVDAAGRGLAGVLVQLGTDRSTGGAPTGGPSAGGPVPEALAPARTWSAEDGSYLLDTAEPARGARVRASLRGYVDAETPGFDVAPSRKVRAPDLILRVGANLEVRVLSPTGTPVVGARLRAAKDAAEAPAPSGFAPAEGDATATTDPSGVALVRHLPAGRVRLEVSARGFVAEERWIDVPDADVAMPGIRFDLRAGTRLEGRVLDERGAPLVGATVRVTGDSGPDAATPPPPESTNAEGQFAIDGLPDAPLVLLAGRAGYAARRVPLERPETGIVVRLAPEDPARENRRRQIQGELLEVGRSLATATGAARTTLQQRGQELMRELETLDEPPKDDASPAR